MPTKTTTKRTPDDSRVYHTQRDLADAAGVTQATISRRLRERDCPISPAGPWDSDDAAAMREWLEGDDADAADRLKRAQAIKAEALAAKYTLAMLVEVGGLGGELFQEFNKALRIAALTHFRETGNRVAAVFRDTGGLEPRTANLLAESFTREYAIGFAEEVARHFKFSNKLNETLRPIITSAEKVVSELRKMGDLNGAAVDQLEAEADVARVVADGKVGRMIPPNRLASPWSPQDFAPRLDLAEQTHTEGAPEDWDK